jgi:cation transporter-like permease
VLVGAGFGAVIALTIHLANGLPTWFSLGGQTTIPLDNDALQGGRLLVAFLFGSPLWALGQAISLVGVFFLGLVLLRRPAAAGILLALIATSLRLGGENFAVELPGAIIAGSLVALVTTRYGLLAMTAAAFFVQMLLVPPLVLDFSAAYAAQTVVVLLVLAMIVIAAFRISLGPRPVFGFALDE